MPVLGLGACVWVSLAPGAERVRLTAPEQVTQCERLGRTSTKVLARVLFVPRSAPRVERELARLARNEALRMGGDAVVPESPVEDGRRSFGVYRCGPSRS